jgi:hypothetical protein
MFKRCFIFPLQIFDRRELAGDNVIVFWRRSVRWKSESSIGNLWFDNLGDCVFLYIYISLHVLCEYLFFRSSKRYRQGAGCTKAGSQNKDTQKDDLCLYCTSSGAEYHCVVFKRQFYSMSRIYNEKCSKPKIFLRSSQNHFVLALFSSL